MWSKEKEQWLHVVVKVKGLILCVSCSMGSIGLCLYVALSITSMYRLEAGLHIVSNYVDIDFLGCLLQKNRSCVEENLPRFVGIYLF